MVARLHVAEAVAFGWEDLRRGSWVGGKCDKQIVYKVMHLIPDLGWVDLDLRCSSACQIILVLMGIWHKRQGN